MGDFERIGTGRANALYYVGINKNTELRKQIAKANKSGTDCIINIEGSGYFRPDPTNEEEAALMEHYLAAELHRAREILYKREQMKKAYALMKKVKEGENDERTN